jgi:hypothetical protein
VTTRDTPSFVLLDDYWSYLAPAYITEGIWWGLAELRSLSYFLALRLLWRLGQANHFHPCVRLSIGHQEAWTKALAALVIISLVMTLVTPDSTIPGPILITEASRFPLATGRENNTLSVCRPSGGLDESPGRLGDRVTHGADIRPRPPPAVRPAVFLFL